MRIIIHPGHNPDGKAACGAVGILRESTCARNIVNEIRRLCPSIDTFSIEDGKDQRDVLNRIVKRVNERDYDLSISVHLNSSNVDSSEGVEAYVWDVANKDSISNRFAQNWLEQMEKLGYRDRGIKPGARLHVINSTKCPSVLIECGFVSNPRDCQLFDASAIAEGIIYACGMKPEEKKDGTIYRVIAGAFHSQENANRFLEDVKSKYPDAYLQEIKNGDG